MRSDDHVSITRIGPGDRPGTLRIKLSDPLAEIFLEMMVDQAAFEADPPIITYSSIVGPDPYSALIGVQDPRQALKYLDLIAKLDRESVRRERQPPPEAGPEPLHPSSDAASPRTDQHCTVPAPISPARTAAATVGAKRTETRSARRGPRAQSNPRDVRKRPEDSSSG